jgi:hypothetical protein
VGYLRMADLGGDRCGTARWVRNWTIGAVWYVRDWDWIVKEPDRGLVSAALVTGPDATLLHARQYTFLE